MEARLSIAQITDTHIVAEGEKVYGRYDTARDLAAVVETLNGLEPRPRLVLVTGDLVHHGRPEEYAHFRRLMSALQMPCLPAVGNHDDRAVFRACMGGLPGDGHDAEYVQYGYDAGPVRVLVLDSFHEGHHTARYGKAKLAWLKGQLQAVGDRPVLLALHHPPFETGITWMDGAGSGWADRLSELIARHSNVGLVVCGHVHRSIQSTVGGARVAVCPGTAYGVALDQSPHLLARFVAGKPAFALHSWTRAGFVSHVATIGEERTAWEVIDRPTLDRLMAYVRAHGSLPKSVSDSERGLG